MQTEKNTDLKSQPIARAEKRAFKRVPANIQARFFYGNRVYEGLVTDVSEKGMFVSTEVRFPMDYIFDVIIFIKGEVLQMPLRVRRTVISGKNYYGRSGMGTEVLDSPQNYLNFVSDRKSSLLS